MTTIASYIFGICFLGLVAFIITLLSFLIVQFLLTPLIHLMGWKNFGELAPPPIEVSRAAENREKRLLAIDFLIQQHIARQREAKQKLYELMHPKTKFRLADLSMSGKPSPEEATDIEETFSLEETWGEEAHLVPVAQKAIRGSENFSPTDLWFLAKFPTDAKTPYYLTNKQSVRGRGLLQAWAPLRDRAIKLPMENARRWVTVLGNDVRILPANSAARVKLREQEHETIQ